MLGLLAASGTGLVIAPALRVLNGPFLALTVLVLARGWYLQLSHGRVTVWQRRAGTVLLLSTATSITLWAVRFAGLLGMKPF